MKKFYPVLLILISSAFFMSCLAPSQTGRTSKYVQTFYTENGNVQYFIKPLEYNSEDNYKLKVDLTLRDSVDNPPARMMFTLTSEEIITGHNECKAGINKNKMSDAKRIFAEPIKDGYNYRYESTIIYSELISLIRDSSQVWVKTGGKELKFTPSRKTKKSLPKIENIVIKMIESQ